MYKYLVRNRFNDVIGGVYGENWLEAWNNAVATFGFLFFESITTVTEPEYDMSPPTHPLDMMCETDTTGG